MTCFQLKCDASNMFLIYFSVTFNRSLWKLKGSIGATGFTYRLQGKWKLWSNIKHCANQVISNFIENPKVWGQRDNTAVKVLALYPAGLLKSLTQRYHPLSTARGQFWAQNLELTQKWNSQLKLMPKIQFLVSGHLFKSYLEGLMKA